MTEEQIQAKITVYRLKLKKIVTRAKELARPMPLPGPPPNAPPAPYTDPEYHHTDSEYEDG